MTPNEKAPDRLAGHSLPSPENMAGADAALWDLLGRARPPAPPSPYFARRVLREVAALEEGRREAREGGGWGALAAFLGLHRRPRLLAAAAAGVALLALTGTGILWHASAPEEGARLARQEVPAASSLSASTGGGEEAGDEGMGVGLEPVTDRDLAVIADLEDLLDTQENRIWLEDDAAS